MKTIRRKGMLACMLSMLTLGVMAEEKEPVVTVSGGADVVSTYTWRGLDQSGAAVQPAIGISAAGFSLSAWGSMPFDMASGLKEIDFTLGYSAGGFSVSVTDYWWSGEATPYFGEDTHYYEAMLGYTFGEKFPLSVSWSTMFAGADKLADGDQAYSTYIQLAYPFEVYTVDCTASLGITPWKGMYADGFDVATIGFRASKDFLQSEKISLPLFVEVIAAPAMKDVHLLAGVSFRL